MTDEPETLIDNPDKFLKTHDKVNIEGTGIKTIINVNKYGVLEVGDPDDSLIVHVDDPIVTFI